MKVIENSTDEEQDVILRLPNPGAESITYCNNCLGLVYAKRNGIIYSNDESEQPDGLNEDHPDSNSKPRIIKTTLQKCKSNGQDLSLNGQST